MKTIVITSPEKIKDEEIICNSLFFHGLETLHLRKPGASISGYEDFLQKIDPRYYNRVVIHDYYELAGKYNLRGIHLKFDTIRTFECEKCYQSVSTSCHSIEEIEQLPVFIDYCFISPVFDSISKQGYKSNFQDLSIFKADNFKTEIIALGGICPENAHQCTLNGMNGVAVLGYIWEQPDEALQRFIRLKTPTVMSIAGFDQSSGAGVTADIKTFEATGSYGLGVVSGITIQNESEYEGTIWTELKDIQSQCAVLFRKHQPDFVKIGLIENFEILEQLTSWLNEQLPNVRIIWDPILKASAGFVFHENNKSGILEKILANIFMITPNSEELRQLFGRHITPEYLQDICQKHNIHILWKGGHNQGSVVTDSLFTVSEIRHFSLQRSKFQKHGTGCILSASILSALAQGEDVISACRKSQAYVSGIIESNDSLLGYHTIGNYPLNIKPSPARLPIQYITDPKEGMTIAEQAEAVCRGGIRWIQLRMKDASPIEILKEGRLIKDICKRYNALFIINDNVEIARQLDADGVHLGKNDTSPLDARNILGKGKIIGATCNTKEDIANAELAGVDYIGLGPYTFTTTKKNLSPVLGLRGYQELLKEISIPAYAIGGITENDIPSLFNTPICGIALSGLIKNSDNLTHKSQEILNLIRESLQKKDNN